MRDNSDIAMTFAIIADFPAAEALVNLASTMPGNNLYVGLLVDVGGQVAIGNEYHPIALQRLDDTDGVAGRATDVRLRF